ncbi:MAG: hypothetical protein AAFP04_03625 [Myxococcota bacterium]
MRSSGAVVIWLQQILESLHQVDSGLDATDFLIDRDRRALLPGAKEQLPEQFFVREEDESIDLALYLCPSVLTKIRVDPPHRRLHSGNIEALCIALEGVSHFVLLTWRAQRDWPVSVLELELQAEVDKFTVCWLLLAEQGVPLRQSAEVLRRHLFRRWSLRDGLPAHEAARYHHASRYAGRFCRRLSCRSEPREVRRLSRRFFRVGLSEKLRNHAVV